MTDAQQNRAFAARAAAAFASARAKALAAGHTIVEAHGGNLCEVRPDGSRKVLRALEPVTKVQSGARYKKGAAV